MKTEFPFLKQNDGTSRPPLALAPMVGLSHCALRSLVAELGGCGIFFTEMLAAKRLPSENPKFSSYLHTTEIEKPLVYQLFLADTTYLEAAIAKIHALGGDGIDINLGCPAPNLKRVGAGAALAENVSRVQEIVRCARKLTHLPLTAKIRLGVEGKDDALLSFCQMLEGEGVDLLTIHARFHGEKFCRKPRWQLLAPICEKLNIPVIANGGIASVADAKKCLELSGADGLMLGRFAVERPWLFSDIAREIYGFDIPVAEREPGLIYFRFIALVEQLFAPEKQLARIKQFTHYIAKNNAFGHHLASRVQSSNTVEEAIEHASTFYDISYSLNSLCRGGTLL